MCIGFMTNEIHPQMMLANSGIRTLKWLARTLNSNHPSQRKGQTSNIWAFVQLYKIPYIHLRTQRSLKHISSTYPYILNYYSRLTLVANPIFYHNLAHITDSQHYHLNRSTLQITDILLEGGWISHTVFTHTERIKYWDNLILCQGCEHHQDEGSLILLLATGDLKNGTTKSLKLCGRWIWN